MRQDRDPNFSHQDQDRLDDQEPIEDDPELRNRSSEDYSPPTSEYEFESSPPPAGSDRDAESGMPGGGVGRREETGRSGVYPMSEERSAPPDARLTSQAEWGQGDRGAAGAQDSGRSELTSYWDERRRAEPGERREDEDRKNDER